MRETIIHSPIGTAMPLSFTNGDFAGIIFSYSRVELIENKKDDNLAIRFQYVIHENLHEEFEEDLFQQEIGEHLHDLLNAGLQDNSIVYTGGT